MPCPFCGRTALTISVELTPDIYEYAHVNYPHLIKRDNLKIVTITCRCGCNFKTEDVGNQTWIKAWNRRARYERVD